MTEATRRIRRPHPRALLAALLIALPMLVVGLFLAGLAVKLLDLSGGAADDTSLVVAVAAFAVTDFWGGGLLTMLTRAPVGQVGVSWGIVRLALLVLVALVATRLALLVPLQLALALVGAWAGARVSRKQLQLRREAELERAEP